MRSCPSKAQCYNDVYNIEYDPEWDWSLPQDEWFDKDSSWDEELSEQKEEFNQEEDNYQEKDVSSSASKDDAYAVRGNSSEADEGQVLDDD